MGGFPERQRNERIAIVDDSLEDLLLFEYAGRDPDLTILTLIGPLAALRRLYAMRYEVDAIVSDLMMAEMDGINFSRQVRQNEQIMGREGAIKLFWFTGWPVDRSNDLDPVVRAAKELDVVEIFTKPYDPLDLITRVRKAIAKGEVSDGVA
jgi:CheY-like chemotaxis protein